MVLSHVRLVLPVFVWLLFALTEKQDLRGSHSSILASFPPPSDGRGCVLGAHLSLGVLAMPPGQYREWLLLLLSCLAVVLFIYLNALVIHISSSLGFQSAAGTSTPLKIKESVGYSTRKSE